MTDQLDKALFQSAATTFEQLGVMSVTPETSAHPSDAVVKAFVCVSFVGPLGGALYMSVYGPVLETLTTNMLCSDETPSVEQQEDAIGEIANVICGNLLPELAGRDAIFEMGVPLVADTDFRGFKIVRPMAEAFLGIEGGGRVELSLLAAPRS